MYMQGRPAGRPALHFVNSANRNSPLNSPLTIRHGYRHHHPPPVIPAVGLENLLGWEFSHENLLKFIRKLFRWLGSGENSLTSAPGAGQAGAKTRQNGGFGLAQKATPKGAKIGPKWSPELSPIWVPKWDPKRSPFRGLESSKTL